MSLGKYIKEMRSQRKLSQWELARLSGLTRSHLSRLELDDYEHPSAETFLALAKGLRVHPNELYHAAGYMVNTKLRTGIKRAPGESSIDDEPANLVSVPVFRGVNGGESDVVDYVCWGLSKNNGRNLKGFLVNGFAFEPEVKEGDVIIVDPDREPSLGNLVLYSHDGKAQLSRYGRPPNGGDEHKEGHLLGLVIGINRALA